MERRRTGRWAFLGRCTRQWCGGSDAGQKSRNFFSAREIVNWYNGHPLFQFLTPDFSGHGAVVVGNGNVALDVARLLLRPVQDLERTDITDMAYSIISASCINEVHVTGRRSVINAAWTTAELREMTTLKGLRVRLATPLQLSEEDKVGVVCCTGCSSWQAFLEGSRQRKRMVELVDKIARGDLQGDPNGSRTLWLHFNSTPLRIAACPASGVAESLYIQRDRSEAMLPCSFGVRSIGYKTVPIPGIRVARPHANVWQGWPWTRRQTRSLTSTGRFMTPASSSVRDGQSEGRPGTSEPTWRTPTRRCPT